MRKHKFAKGEFYHIYAHCVDGLKLFHNKRDYERFLSLLFAANGSDPILRLDRFSDLNSVWGIKNKKIELGEPLVDIVGFCLMPTHFHLLLGEKNDSNISKYIHKIMVSHSKYFNKKYDRRGHVFEGKFNSKHISDNKYLLILSSYLHKNPTKIKRWKNKEEFYPWSSYQDYVLENRWGNLLSKNIIESQFKNKLEYKNFIEEHYRESESGLN